MGKYKDLTGIRVNRLTVIDRAVDHTSPNGKQRTMWNCICDCGALVTVRSDSLISGRIHSCGCYQKERVAVIAKETAKDRVKYGDSRERLRNIWYLIKHRCTNPDSPAYKNYGGRGITLCEEWFDDIDGYFSFKEWSIANGYRDDLTIDRIDNDKGYSPDNCRWADRLTQSNNTRKNRYISHDGELHTVSEWARIAGIPMKTLHKRIKLGWDFERAIKQPLRKY